MSLESFNGWRGQAIGEAARAYEEITCRTISRPIIEDISYFVDQNIKTCLFKKVYEVAAEKGAGWRYAKAILNRCVNDLIFTAYDWDWRIRFRKAEAEVRKEHPFADEPTIVSMVALKEFKKDLQEIEQDAERYAYAASNGLDTSEWEERWRGFEFIV